MKKILIIDIETTGLSPKTNHLTEIGIVELDLSNGERKILFDKTMHEKPIDKDFLEICYPVKQGWVTVDEIVNSKEFIFYKDEVQSIINEYPFGITAYNNSFDFGFLERAGITFPNKLACPMLLSRNVCKLPKKGGGYKNPKMQEAYDFFFPNSGYVELHRGASDAMHEAEIVYEMYKLGIFKLSNTTSNSPHDKQSKISSTKNGFTKRNCDNRYCGKEYMADDRNLKRGWGLCCSKKCAAKKREMSKPGYNPEKVERNNLKRELLSLLNKSDKYTDDEYTADDYNSEWGDNDQWGDCDLGIHE